LGDGVGFVDLAGSFYGDPLTSTVPLKGPLPGLPPSLDVGPGGEAGMDATALISRYWA
jgi:hypothetical protein